MPSTFTTTLLTLASLASLSTAALNIQNNCGADVYLDNVCGPNSNYQTIPGGGTTISIPNPGGQGSDYACSAKVSTNGDLSNVLQFEFSIGADNNLWYDLSAQNGDPFVASWRGVTTGNGDSGSSSCPGDIACQPNDESCASSGTTLPGRLTSVIWTRISGSGSARWIGGAS